MSCRPIAGCGIAFLAWLALPCARGAEQQEPNCSKASSLRLDGIFRACGGARHAADNPFGLNSRQWESPEANRELFRDIQSRAVAMQKATSKPVRIVFHQPGGWFKADRGGMQGAFPTAAVMNGRMKDGKQLYPWRWKIWADELAAIAKAHPDWILGVYFSGQVPTADAQDAVDARQRYEIYDHDDARHRRLVMQVVDQWLAVGVREFLFDGTSRPERSADIPKLAEAIRAEGGRLFVEAHPKDADQELRRDLLKQIDGSLATHRYMVNNEPASLDWTVPEGAVMMVVLTGHRVSKKPTRSTPVSSDVRSYRKRGFVILSGGGTFDSFITKAEIGD